MTAMINSLLMSGVGDGHARGGNTLDFHQLGGTS
jgi:hypothetical protein